VRSEKEIEAKARALGPDAEGSADRRLFFDPSSFARALRWALDGPPQRERVVSGCGGCPAFYEPQDFMTPWCQVEGRDSPRSARCDSGSPDWCPLREGPIVLRLVDHD
jgi:hypothetical protein